MLALGYLYWILKVKPNLQNGQSDNQTPVNGYWEVTRSYPNRVSITIYREPRPPSDPEVSVTEGSAPRRRKGDCDAIQLQENITSQAPIQLGVVGTSDIHLVPPPPPPPPVFWTAAAPSIGMMPPPPPPGPSTFLPPGQHPAHLHPSPLGFGTAAYPCASEAPPPYFSYAAPQSFQGQTPGLGNMASAQPAWAPPTAPPMGPPVGPPMVAPMAALMAAPMVPPMAPPPARPVTPQRHNADRTTQATPPVENPGWRRWFSLGTRAPTPGHARTLSNSSTSTVVRSRSPSPPPSSVSPPRRTRERNHPRRPSARRRPTRQAPQPRQNLRNRAQRQPRYDSSSPSESSADSSYLNTSAELVHDNHEPYPGFRHHARRSSVPERRRRQSINRETRLVPSQSAPHSSQRQQQASYPQEPRRYPSPDLQFPSPEPRRPRVSFTLPTDSEEESTTSSRSSEHRRRSSTRPHRSRRDSNGERDGRRGPPRRDREPPGLADRITGTFYRMRRALRGEED